MYFDFGPLIRFVFFAIAFLITIAVTLLVASIVSLFWAIPVWVVAIVALVLSGTVGAISAFVVD